MKQVVQDLRSGAPSVLEVPVPSPSSGQARIRTHASLVSAGTERALMDFAGKNLLAKAQARPDLVKQTLELVRRDGLLPALEAVRSRIGVPIPLGYSSAGEIEAVGPELSGFRVGDRVACGGGGQAAHAEYAVVSEHLMAHIPPAVGDDAAAFGTLGAVALHGFRLTGTQLGERVAVVGLGLLGQLATQIARAAGCSVLGIDVELGRVALAEELGSAATTRQGATDAALAFSDGQGADAVLICAHADDNDPLVLAGEIARERANVVLVGAVGMEVPRKLYYDKELNLTVSRSYGPGRYDPDYEDKGQDYPIGYVRWTEQRNIAGFLELLERGEVQVEPLVTHRFPIDQAEQAYEALGDHSALGVVLTYPGEPTPDAKVVVGKKPVRAEAQVRLGVLGAGNFARRVALPNVKKLRGVERVGVATAGGVSGATAAQAFGFQYATTVEGEILEDDTINTVAILTRHSQHAGQVSRALEAGKHVFCEKPLAIDRAGLDRVLATLEKSNGLLIVGYNRRFAPLAVQMKEHMDMAGEPLSIHYRVNAWPLPLDHWTHDPDEGGRLIGEACHFIDFLIYLVGEGPVSVRTLGLPDGERYREDNVHIVLEFPGGSLGTIDYLANGDREFPKERVEVFGGGHVAALDDFRALHLEGGGIKTRHNKGHAEIWEAFAAAVRAGGPPPIPYTQLASGASATLAAVESLRSGERIELETYAD